MKIAQVSPLVEAVPPKLYGGTERIVAYPNGSVPEVIEDGVTGFIVDGEEPAARAINMLRRLDRSQIRRTFEKRFTARRMAEDYLRVYRRAISLNRPLQQAV
jgi:glycosyltransferase involved in cell wall biosynthesis